MLFFISLAFLVHGIAQEKKDTLHLPVVEIKANYLLDNLGFKRTKMDSVLLIPHLNADLSTILSQYSTIFIKSYGNGTLATPSFRGTSAHHTQVEWNGINLNSPMLGQMDLSQVPVAQFDGIEILYGPAGIVRTSGAFGGVINLVTNPNWNNRVNFSLSQTIASFDTYTTNLNLAFGSQSIQSHSKINYSSALNDFPFYNDIRDSVMRQQNASYKLFGFSQEVFWKIKDKHLLSGRVWYSQNDRNLPPTNSTIGKNSTEKQMDNALRAVLEYKYVERKYNLMVRSALVDQFMNYLLNDSLNNINSHHHSYSSINRVRFTYHGIPKLSIKPGFDLTYDWVISDGYAGMKTRNTVGLFSEIIYDAHKKVKMSLVLREDLLNGKFMPFIPAFGIQYDPFNKINLSFSFNLARNYRYPTLNDLYWVPYGNPELKPEYNYSAEMGCTFNILNQNKKIFLESTLTGYYSKIFDLIMWAPIESDPSKWSPFNITEVLARGIEAGLTLKFDVVGFEIGLENNYNYCRSTYEKEKSEGDNSKGKQLFYVPIHLFNSTLSVEKYRFFLSYNFSYTSKRYTGYDNVAYMPAYSISNIFFGKNFILNKFALSLLIQINNLFDLDYQSVANRPMPGLNYSVTVKIKFNK